MFKNPSKMSFAPRLGVAWNPFGDQEDDGQGGLRPLLPAADDLVLSRHDVPHLPVLRGRRHPAAAVFGPGIIAGARGRASIPRRSRSGPSSSSTTRSSPTRSSGTCTSNAISATAWWRKSATSDRRGTTCRSTAIPNTVPSEYGADGVKRLVPGATLRYPSWGRIRTRINEARSIYNGMTVSLNKRYSNGCSSRCRTPTATRATRGRAGRLAAPTSTTAPAARPTGGHPEYEYGPSSFDVRHTLVFNAVYQLPFGQRQPAAPGGSSRAGRSASSRISRAACRSRRSIGFDQVGDRQSDTGLQKPNVNGDVNYPHTADQWFDPSIVQPAGGGRLRQRDTEFAPRTGPEGRRPVGLQEPAVRTP